MFEDGEVQLSICTGGGVDPPPTSRAEERRSEEGDFMGDCRIGP